MWAYSIMILMASFSFLFMPFPEGFNNQHTTVGENESLAQEFIIYKSAVLKYAGDNPAFTGVIPDNLLTLPSTINLSGNWKNNILAGRILYVYGETRAGLNRIIMEKTDGSLSIGINNNGTMYSSVAGLTATIVPGWIPNNNILSILEIN